MPCLDNITDVPNAPVEYRLCDAVVKGCAALIRVSKPAAKIRIDISDRGSEGLRLRDEVMARDLHQGFGVEYCDEKAENRHD